MRTFLVASVLFVSTVARAQTPAVWVAPSTPKIRPNDPAGAATSAALEAARWPDALVPAVDDVVGEPWNAFPITARGGCSFGLGALGGRGGLGLSLLVALGLALLRRPRNR